MTPGWRHRPRSCLSLKVPAAWTGNRVQDAAGGKGVLLSAGSKFKGAGGGIQIGEGVSTTPRSRRKKKKQCTLTTQMRHARARRPDTNHAREGSTEPCKGLVHMRIYAYYVCLYLAPFRAETCCLRPR
ncbi:hypothetical protein MRX96_002868 [Rhipicephalus microplus]